MACRVESVELQLNNTGLQSDYLRLKRMDEREYDSMAPGITILVGWIPGLIYSLLCVLMVAIVSTFYGRFTS